METQDRDDDKPLGVFIGIRNAFAILIATAAAIALVVTLINLPGIP
jgi:hypothetical protein